jgi:predicted alpha/beta-fold hydrolase
MCVYETVYSVPTMFDEVVAYVFHVMSVIHAAALDLTSAHPPADSASALQTGSESDAVSVENSVKDAVLSNLAIEVEQSAASNIASAVMAALLSAHTVADSYSLLDSNASNGFNDNAVANSFSVDDSLVYISALYHNSSTFVGATLSEAQQQWQHCVIDWQSNEAIVGITVAAVLLSLLLYTFYYFTSAAVRPQLYTQHSIAGSHALATQRPPVKIDTSSLSALQAVEYAVSPASHFGQLISQRYLPTPWLSLPLLSGHLQTVLTAKASPYWLQTPYVTYKRELFPVTPASAHTLPGQVALDWAVLGKARQRTAQPMEWQNAFTDTTPTVIVCHGLAGGSSEHYVKNTIFALSQPPFNFRCVVFNARGCGGTELLSPQLYCGAYTEDLRQVVIELHARLPNAPLLAVGFSLGANILTKFLGEEGLAGRLAPFNAAIAVANPFDFLHGARHLDSNIIQRNLYSRTLASNLIRLFKTHMHVLDRDGSRQRQMNSSSPQTVSFDASEEMDVPAEDGPLLASTPPLPRSEQWDLKEVFNSPTLREFDKRLTRIVFGYATVDDYYRDASSARFVKFIHTPTLFINALDDPISSPQAIPYDECSVNPFVTLLTTPTGGHSMDHFTGICQVNSWSAKVIAAFFADITSLHGSVGNNQSRVSIPIETPPPRILVQSDHHHLDENGFVDMDENEIPSTSFIQHQHHGWRAVPFTPSAPNWNGLFDQSRNNNNNHTDVVTSMQHALELQHRLAQMEKVLEETCQGVEDDIDA